MYSFLGYLKRLGGFWHKPAKVPRHCIFDQRYGCAIPYPIPTESLGTSFDCENTWIWQEKIKTYVALFLSQVQPHRE